MKEFDFCYELSKYEIPCDVVSIEDVKSGKVNIPESWSFLYESTKGDWVKKVIEQWSRLDHFYLSLLFVFRVAYIL
ncbi:hypothetical protein TUMSATVNIG1_19490 [Vibrio nigripulchritudo]|nr:hypothetical protein VNTUMSATTG_19280 [Vibrio nigripulchritudo]BDU31340.1 hypothetical protein TUMSATVNIG1_19490 [Vibrio nigripulchritudo]